MKLKTLKKLCLSYLEQDDTNVMKTEIRVLEQDDVFKEYLNNIDGSIYNAISRLVQSYKLPIMTLPVKFDEFENNMVRLPQNCYQVKEISLMTKEGLYGNIKYQVVGNSVFIPNIVANTMYLIVYYPRFLYFDSYLNDELTDINEIDLAENGLPDELAITIKYAVFGDMKSEENPNLAVVNRNYFESILSENNRVDIITNQGNTQSKDDNDWSTPDTPQRVGDPICPFD